jgi:plasmid maintenance system antidote protein VapI
MKMKTYIEKGEKKAGNLAELAKILEIKANYLSMVKTNKRGLPVEVCIQLAEFIDENELHVIAASNLVTEKDERKRKILESCFRRVAGIAAIVLFIGSISMTSPTVQAKNISLEAEQFILC